MSRSVFPLALVLLLGGCATSPAAPEATPSTPAASPARPACQEIATLCHDHAEHGGVMSDCHHMGHDPKSSNEMCLAKKSECQAACK